MTTVFTGIRDQEFRSRARWIDFLLNINGIESFEAFVVNIYVTQEAKKLSSSTVLVVMKANVYSSFDVPL
jgi:hypothetical protein